MLCATLAAGKTLAPGFTVTNALSSLLTAESLLFAALSLAANLSMPGGPLVRRLPIPGGWLAGIAIGGLVAVSLGAAVAWGKIFVCAFPSDASGILVAVALIVAIVIQPALAVLL